MSNSQKLAERIKIRSKECNLTVKAMLRDSDIKDSNFITKIENGTNVGYMNIVKIADTLDCSVDYLLGRSDEVCPKHDVIIQTGDVNAKNNKGDVDIDTSVNINSDISKEVLELVDLIQSLPLMKRAEAILLIGKLKEE